MKRLAIAPNALWRREGEGIVILDEIRGEPYHLDEIGAFLFERLETPRTFVDLVALAKENYEGDPEEIRQDVQLFLEALLELRLLVPCEDAAQQPEPPADGGSGPR